MKQFLEIFAVFEVLTALSLFISEYYILGAITYLAFLITIFIIWTLNKNEEI